MFVYQCVILFPWTTASHRLQWNIISCYNNYAIKTPIVSFSFLFPREWNIIPMQYLEYGFFSDSKCIELLPLRTVDIIFCTYINKCVFSSETDRCTGRYSVLVFRIPDNKYTQSLYAHTCDSISCAQSQIEQHVFYWNGGTLVWRTGMHCPNMYYFMFWVHKISWGLTQWINVDSCIAWWTVFIAQWTLIWNEWRTWALREQDGIYIWYDRKTSILRDWFWHYAHQRVFTGKIISEAPNYFSW